MLSGAAFNNGSLIPLLFSRVIPLLDLVEGIKVPLAFAVARPVVAKSSCLNHDHPISFLSPTTRGAQGALVGIDRDGLSGAVYALELSTDLHSVPCRVVKFVLRKRNKAMIREAWFYDELQPLQGTVVPRCCGYYEAILPPNCTVIPWKMVEDN